MSYVGDVAMRLCCRSEGESKIIILAVLNKTVAWGTLAAHNGSAALLGQSPDVIDIVCDLWGAQGSSTRWAGTENWNTWSGFSLHAAVSAAHWYWTSHFLFEAALFTSQRAIFAGGGSACAVHWRKGHVVSEHVSQHFSGRLFSWTGLLWRRVQSLIC